MKRTLIKDTSHCVGEKVRICGFINSVRAHGSLLFFDVRDRSGIVQAVITADTDSYKIAQRMRPEWVVELVGEVKKRPEKMKNPDIDTGEIEIEIEEVNVLSEAKTAPFSVSSDGGEINEEIRMKYRYLDLRRERMQTNLKMRHKVMHYLRNYLYEKDFTEIETPILTKSTPEGARDFLVPSRIHPGSFYALPQSPQQYKQLLMVSGMENYFQFARCFRDEDLRGDRQPEFTQLDIEFSFMETEEILLLVEEMMVEMIESLFPQKKIKKKPFPRITYNEAMEKWGCDSPDLRENKNDDKELAFAFVTDFPMFEKNEKGEWTSVHHPFTRTLENAEEIKKDPGKIKALQYDLVLNGNEIAGGSLRSHKLDVLQAVFEVLGHSKQDIDQKFKHLFEAFSYGVPPHGGIAFGFERLLMVLQGEKNIREVMAFPKTGDGRELMMGSPSSNISEDQLKELKIEIKNERERKNTS